MQNAHRAYRTRLSLVYMWRDTRKKFSDEIIKQMKNKIKREMENRK